MSLCRHYVRELRRSVLIETPEMEKANPASKRSSMLLDQFDLNDDSGPAGTKDYQKTRDQHLSAFLRQENFSAPANHSAHSSDGSARSKESGVRRSGSQGERPPRPSFMGSALQETSDSQSPAHTVARADLRASAEKILYTFLLPGSEREIILPTGIMTDICASIEEDHRDDPEVFDAAKDYTFQAMERDAFPGFLRSKALGNLVPSSMFARLILGLVALFGGFWAGFILIFLNEPKHVRSWVSHRPATLPPSPSSVSPCKD